MAARQRVFAFSRFVAAGALLLAVLLWLVAALVIGAGLLLLPAHLVAGMFLGVMGIGMLALCRVVQRDASAKWRWRVALAGDRVFLELPAGRSWLHRDGGFSGTLLYSDIEAIVCRPEVYRQLGACTEVQPYWLILADGSRLLLGEDRQVSNAYATMTRRMFRTAEALATASRTRITTLANAEGEAGILAIWGAKPPPWPEF